VILFLGRLVRILAVLFLLRVFLRFVVAVVRGYRGPSRAEAAGAPGVELVRDPVCRTFLPRDRAFTALVDGRPQHFCSASCRDRALAPPS
jgi:hypothetical protein